MSTSTMFRPAALQRLPRCYLLGGFVIKPIVAAAWASRLLNGKDLDPWSNFTTICTAILEKVHQYQANLDFVREVWPNKAKYIVITRSAKFSGYKDMDPCDIPKFKEGDKEAKI